MNYFIKRINIFLALYGLTLDCDPKSEEDFENICIVDKNDAVVGVIKKENEDNYAINFTTEELGVNNGEIVITSNEEATNYAMNCISKKSTADSDLIYQGMTFITVNDSSKRNSVEASMVIFKDKTPIVTLTVGNGKDAHRLKVGDAELILRFDRREGMAFLVGSFSDDARDIRPGQYQPQSNGNGGCLSRSKYDLLLSFRGEESLKITSDSYFKGYVNSYFYEHSELGSKSNKMQSIRFENAPIRGIDDPCNISHSEIRNLFALADYFVDKRKNGITRENERCKIPQGETSLMSHKEMINEVMRITTMGDICLLKNFISIVFGGCRFFLEDYHIRSIFGFSPLASEGVSVLDKESYVMSEDEKRKLARQGYRGFHL